MTETQYVLSQTKYGKKEWIPLPTGGVAAHNQAWSTITDTPTTLLGYGITDGGAMEWPGAGIPLSTGASPWGTSYTTSGSGTVIPLTASPAFTGKIDLTGPLNQAGTGLDISGTYNKTTIFSDTTNHFLIEAPRATDAAGGTKLNYYFSHRGAGTAGALMTLLGTGALGIGMTPAAGVIFETSSNVRFNGSIYLKNGYSAEILNPNYNTKDIQFVGTAETMIIKQDGKVGIGTTTPSELLHVAGNGIITGSLMVYSS